MTAEAKIDYRGFSFPKKGEVRLTGADYERFKLQILERDNWT